MSVEGDPTSSTFYINSLNPLKPAYNEPKSEGDDHICLVKKSIKNTFPNIDAPVTATEDELNYVDVTTLGTQQASKAVTADANNTVTVPSGGEINFASGSALQIAGVAVTATAAELNKLSGVTATTAELNKLAGVTSDSTELNYLDITTLGTQQASKVLTADSSNTLTVPSGGEINFASGSQLQIGGVQVTSSAAELNYNDITTLGTQQASKVLTADANNTLTVPSGGEINFASGSQLQIAGVQVTSNATELNLLDGVTSLASGPTLDTVKQATGSAVVTFTGIPAGTNRIDIAMSAASAGSGADLLVALGDSGGVETADHFSTCAKITDTGVEEETGPVTGMLFAQNFGSSETVYGIITLIRLTGNEWVMSGQVRSSTSVYNSAGYKETSAELDRVSIIASSGYPENNSRFNILYH